MSLLYVKYLALVPGIDQLKVSVFSDASNNNGK